MASSLHLDKNDLSNFGAAYFGATITWDGAKVNIRLPGFPFAMDIQEFAVKGGLTGEKLKVKVHGVQVRPNGVDISFSAD